MSKRYQEKHDEQGFEIVDTRRVEMPLRFKRMSAAGQTAEMRRLIKEEMSIYARRQGMETFEEADDFDVGDDDFVTPYEMSLMQEEAVLRREIDGDDPDSKGEKGEGAPKESGVPSEDGGGKEEPPPA